MLFKQTLSDAFRAMRPATLLAGGIVILSNCITYAQTPFPTNNDPSNQIRFDTPAAADARRAQLVDFIWDGGLPTTLPAVTQNVTLPNLAIGIDPANVARADRLDANVAGWDFHAFSYLLHPTNTSNANKVVIVHQGHADTFESGVGSTANHLLRNGFTVALMQMPLHGWNTDRTAVIPGRGTLTYNSHDQMILNTAVNQGGEGFRLFLEPVVQNINYVTANIAGLEEVGMVGLSGGGWTTSLASAVDPRIKRSAPVAGSAPLYQRNIDGNSATIGDAEQYYLPLYREDIAADGSGGGVATWLEIYALGAYGEGRQQIQVTNEFDACCFSGTAANSYKNIVADKVNHLAAGKFQHSLDSSHELHMISRQTIADAINPLFGITKPAPVPSGLPISDQFDDQTNTFPANWTPDPSNSIQATAVENGGRLTLRGAGLSSIMRTAPFNPQSNQKTTITLDLQSMSSDSAGGVFITDEAGARPHHLGVHINMATKEVIVNADNGEGFSALGDRVNLGRFARYNGGAATLEMTFSAEGFSVTIDGGSAGKFDSGLHAWSEVPNGFDPANLGEHVHLFIQNSDTNGETPATIIVNGISVEAVAVPETQTSWLFISGSLASFFFWKCAT